jgi:hypothetical protein
MAQKMTSKRVGGIRPSQIMYTYGVGATVDLPNFTVIIAGLDDWDEMHQPIILEERLLAAIRLDGHVGPQLASLRGAPWEPETRDVFDEWARIGVPVIPFPRWLRCSNGGCNRLSTVDSKLFELDIPASKPHEARYIHRCTAKGKPPVAVPARFVVACPDGHIDEFPWVEFCHQGHPCPQPTLEVFDVGEGTRSTNVGVKCSSCGAKEYLSKAFGQKSEQLLPKCRGRMPHLRQMSGKCENQTVALLLGASNSWFPVTRSVLSIPAGSDPLTQLVAEHFAKLDLIQSPDQVSVALQFGDELAPLRGFDPQLVWVAIETRRAGVAEPGDQDVLSPEWKVLSDPGSAPAGPDFKLSLAGVPAGFAGRVEPTVRAERLREVVALTGFTRLEAPDAIPHRSEPPAKTVSLSKKAPFWLPAAETRGEGIFLRLPEDAVQDWEDKFSASPRLEALRDSQKRWRTRRGLDPAGGWPGERYVLLHSLSHALINEFSLECGYSAASIRERIYSREPGGTNPPMAGVLLYTAAPDTEGTLGGLVSLGDAEVLGRLLNQALKRSELCSTDPMCAEHLPSESDLSMHGASCHACLFVPETSCEMGNRFLDRAVLVPTLASAKIEYFS